MSLFDKFDIVNHIIGKYKSDYEEDISPIKLQKSLYLLFAFWVEKVTGDKLTLDNMQNNYFSDVNFGNCDVELFEPQFEAWHYGPVDPEIYQMYKYGGKSADKQLYAKLLDDQEKLSIINFLNSKLDQIFATNDFTLVDITHEDQCWQLAYNNSNSHQMKGEDIINEHTVR